METLVAVGILGLIGTGILTAINTSTESAGRLDEDVVATNLATAYIEAIKAMPYASSYNVPHTEVSIPPQYDINLDIKFTSDGDTSDGITWVDSYTDEHIQKLTVTVSREGGEQVLAICAFKTRR
jgi:type II secretory pathway pseudopilin PulG